MQYPYRSLNDTGLLFVVAQRHVWVFPVSPRLLLPHWSNRSEAAFILEVSKTGLALPVTSYKSREGGETVQTVLGHERDNISSPNYSPEMIEPTQAEQKCEELDSSRTSLRVSVDPSLSSWG